MLDNHFHWLPEVLATVQSPHAISFLTSAYPGPHLFVTWISTWMSDADWWLKSISIGAIWNTLGVKWFQGIE